KMRCYMRFIIGALFSVFSFLSYAANDGGVSLGATRVVFPSDKNSVVLAVNNSSSSATWLLRAWISEYGHDVQSSKKEEPFVITPPLYRLESSDKIQLRINKTQADKLPVDRESVFYINVLAIPPETKIQAEGKDKAESMGGHIQFAINNRIKLLYRPQDINDQNEIKKALLSLKITRQGQEISVDNNSPYYFTLANIKINGHNLPESVINSTDFMVPPFGHMTFPAPGARDMVWDTINDYGAFVKGTPLHF
ncbi:fimbrial biogenesis chaperone, partial [Salmonella enterica]